MISLDAFKSYLDICEYYSETSLNLYSITNGGLDIHKIVTNDDEFFSPEIVIINLLSISMGDDKSLIGDWFFECDNGRNIKDDSIFNKLNIHSVEDLYNTLMVAHKWIYG